MLVEDGVAAERGVEDADVEGSLEDEHEEGDPEDGGGENLDDGRGVDRPDEEGHVEPAHAGDAELMDGGDEVHPREDGGEAEDEGAEDHGGGSAPGRAGAVGGVEGPPGLDAALEDGPDGEEAAEDIGVPADEVEPGEGDILGADHDGEEEVPERGGDAGDDEEEDHDGAVGGEGAVVGVVGGDRLARFRPGPEHLPVDDGLARRGVDDGAGRFPELQPEDEGGDAAEEEGEQDRHEVHHADLLVVDRVEPRPDGRGECLFGRQITGIGMTAHGLRSNSPPGGGILVFRGGRNCYLPASAACRASISACESFFTASASAGLSLRLLMYMMSASSSRSVSLPW